MEFLTDPFQLSFMQRALAAAVLTVIGTSLVGTWVVLRGMSFMGDALVHGVIPGIALGVLLGFNLLLGASIAAVVMVVGINLVHRQTAFPEDTGIGLLFVGMLALGVIIVSRVPSFTGSLTEILFGDALGVEGADVVVLAVMASVATIASLVLYRPFLVLSFNESKAQLLGLHPTGAHFAMLALITVTIVGSFRTVGTLLVFGLLIGPPATAALLARRVPSMMLTSVGVGIVSVYLGLLLSYYLGTSASATMAAVPVALFFMVLAFRSLRPGVGSAR